MFLGSPRCFVIVKNLKRNRQDKNLIPAHKSIFHPVAWEQPPERGLLAVGTCPRIPALLPSRGVGPGCLQSPAPWFLAPGRPPAPTCPPTPPSPSREQALKVGRKQRCRWWWLSGLAPFYPCQSALSPQTSGLASPIPGPTLGLSGSGCPALHPGHGWASSI